MCMYCLNCMHINFYQCMYIYNLINKLFTLGTPTKPIVAVLPGRLIKLKVNNFMLQMRCLPNDRSFNYTWERKNKQIPLTALKINSHRLIITNLKPDDSGEYRCIMSNSTGQIASDYSLVTIKGLIL